MRATKFYILRCFTSTTAKVSETYLIGPFSSRSLAQKYNHKTVFDDKPRTFSEFHTISRVTARPPADMIPLRPKQEVIFDIPETQKRK